MLSRDSEGNPKCTQRIVNMELERITVESWINPEVWQQITGWHGLSQTIFQTACEKSARCSSNVSRDLNVLKKLQPRGHLSEFLPAFIKRKVSWTYLAAWWRWRREDPPGNVNCGGVGPGSPYGPTAVSSLPSPKCSSFVLTHRHSTTTLQCDRRLSQGNNKCTWRLIGTPHGKNYIITKIFKIQTSSVIWRRIDW